MELKSASYESKTSVGLPEGAEVIKKDISINVEEIENGFIIRKSFDIQYSLNGDTDYLYYNKKWYSKDNPLSLNEDDEEMSLAEKFE